jgi:glycogen synthase
LHIGFASLESPFDTSGGGGIAAYLRALIPEFVAAGHRVTVLANSREKNEQLRCGGKVRIVPVALPNLHWYLGKVRPLKALLTLPVRQIEWSAQFGKAAAEIFRDDRPDVIECGEAGALMLARKPVAPLIMRLHGSNHAFQRFSGGDLGPGTRLDRRLEISAMRRCAAISAPSHFQAGEASRETGCGIEAISVIPNPLPAAFLADAGEATRAASMVLYTGRLAPVKGIAPLLEAAREVRKAESGVDFVLAGPWQMSGTPASWGLAADGVTWKGHVPWDEIAKLYSAASVFVMPSWFESFGISVIEAMASGLPVVASRAGALPGIVEEGVTGLLVPPGDSGALAGAILRLMRDPGMRRQMGQAGRERVLARYTPARVARETLGLYARCASC